jgi:hypothetical protein
MFVVILLLLLILLAIVALRWGYDSRDGLESKEWRQRSKRGLSW